MKYKMVLKSWGHEKWIANSKLYCLKEFLILKDKWTSSGLFHYHKAKTETFYVVNGEMMLDVVINGEVQGNILRPGDSYTITPLTGHRFTSITDKCVCFEASTQHFESDSYRCVLEDLPSNE